MPSERKRRAEIVRLIITTRERFPHAPSLTAALKRVIWRYAGSPTLPHSRRKPRRASSKGRDRSEGEVS